MRFKLLPALLLISLFALTKAQVKNNWSDVTGSAYLGNKSYDFLERICDEAGGRLLGSEANVKATGILKEELLAMGCSVSTEKFEVPGWVRGDDEVEMISPAQRKLQAVALGYTPSTPEFTADLIYCSYGFDENYEGKDARGKVVLVTQESPRGKEGLLRYEAIKIAAAHGAKAILFINTREGSLNMAGTGDFQGYPIKIPAYSLTMEEGKWLERLSGREIPVKIKMTTRSYCKNMTTANTVVSFKGKVNAKLVIGAHFDSWDLGQGAVDNGIGTAILFDVARLLNKFSPDNYYSIDLVWFNGEELGLWGSKNYMKMHSRDSIIAMINMDMTGTPTGFNVMGFDEFIPFFTNLKEKMNGFNLSNGVISSPGTNSDHMPFMFAGIPTFSLPAHLEENMYKYYHERGDSFDKVNKKYLSDAAAVVSIMAEELANDTNLKFRIRSSAEMVNMFKKYSLDGILKREGEWIYKED